MAIKRMRVDEVIDTSFYIEETADKGDLAAIYTAGSGINVDNTNNVVSVIDNPSGYAVAGFILQTVVDIDPDTDYRTKEEVVTYINDKVPLMRKGTIVTDKVLGNPFAKDVAYIGASGYVATTGQLLYQAATYEKYVVGTFEGRKDEDGYVRISVDIK
jgi:hypothetical protein